MRAVVGIYLHIFGAVLCGASAKAVKTERILISGVAAVIVVLTAGIKLAEHKLPVILSLFLVPAKRHAAAEVLDLQRLVRKNGYFYLASVTLSRLVHRV